MSLLKRMFFILLFHLSIHAHSQNNFREFSQELSQPYVYSIVQDVNGYLWIGTGNGLTKYDGITFKPFSVNDSLADNFITCSFIDEDNIWFGHMNGRFSFYNGKKFKSQANLSQKSVITDIDKNYTGEIWASSYSNGLVLLNSKSDIKQKPLENQIPVFAFKFLENNELLVGSVNGLLHCRLKSGELKLIKKIPGIPESKISDIIKTKEGSGFYIAQDDGIYKVDFDGKEFSVAQIGAGLKIDYSGVQCIFEDSGQNLWIATFGNGLIKLNHISGKFDHPEFYNKSTGFSTNHVKTVFEDREGNIWSGNYGTGLTQITGKTFFFDSLDEQHRGSAIYSIFVSGNTKWAGTENGLLKIDQSTNKILKFYSNTNGLPADKVTSIFSLNNELWIGTEKNGLFRMLIDKDKFISYEIAKGALENSITTITGKNNQIWIGTKKGVCSIDLATNTSKWYTHSQGGLPHNSVNHLLIDTKGKVWVLTLSNTLAVIENGIVGKKTIFSEKRIHSLGPIIEENDSTFWIGSLGSGVFQIKADTLINLTTKEGLLSDYCYSMILDNNKNLWIGHRGGISKVRLMDFFTKPIQDLNDFKSSCEFNPNAVFKDEKNRISFGTSEGLLTYDPALESKLVLLPPVLNITSLKVNDKEIEFSEEMSLSPGHYKIEIEFIGVNLKEPTLVNYKYELVGYDRSPETTNTNRIVYPHLSEGEYTFKLWAYSGDGVITKSPLTFKIIIKTPIWKHWWFYVLIVVLFQVIFIIYNKKRELKHLQEKRILEAKVRERTCELAQKNALLQEKQQEIINQNEELEKYQNYLEELVKARTLELLKAKNKAEESDRLKTAILNNLSHEVRTPMNAICGFSKLLDDESLTKKEKADYIRIINQNTEALLSMISEILDMSLIEANQLTFTNDKVDVDELLSDLEKQYHLGNNKNISLEFTNKVQENRSYIYCDIERLRQVFTNLLNNAFKFTESGYIKFGYEILDKRIKFFVSDTGIGIKKTDSEKIFDLFQKIENNPKKFYRGAGVGLATNKKIVELMGGEIWVESAVNKGATFYFTLPINSETIEDKLNNMDNLTLS